MTDSRLRVLVVSWIALTVFGLSFLWDYETGPGAPASPPSLWPVESTIPLDPDRLTLVLFAHPHCPCTEATVGELDRLVARCDGKIAPHVLFYRPSHTTDDWSLTDLWREAKSIPGVDVQLDPAGAQSRLFGASTSGQVLVYRPDGTQVFSGGITPSRGHSGDSFGRTAIIELVFDNECKRATAPVFGCLIMDPQRLNPQSQPMEASENKP